MFRCHDEFITNLLLVETLKLWLNFTYYVRMLFNSQDLSLQMASTFGDKKLSSLSRHLTICPPTCQSYFTHANCEALLHLMHCHVNSIMYSLLLNLKVYVCYIRLYGSWICWSHDFIAKFHPPVNKLCDWWQNMFSNAYNTFISFILFDFWSL